jgi:hypothetical protein
VCGYAATPDDNISQSPNDCSWRIVLKNSAVEAEGDR